MGKRLLVLALVLTASIAGCSSSDVEVLTYGAGPGALRVGELCIPPGEESPEFPGFYGSGAELQTIDPQCASGGCLVYNFQGRIGCPEGNAGPNECYTPAGELVTVDVRPHERGVSPEARVYCSCRCDGPPDLRPFCECPDSMKCEPIFGYSVGQYGSPDAAGSYCVKQ